MLHILQSSEILPKIFKLICGRFKRIFIFLSCASCVYDENCQSRLMHLRTNLHLLSVYASKIKKYIRCRLIYLRSTVAYIRCQFMHLRSKAHLLSVMHMKSIVQSVPVYASKIKSNFLPVLHLKSLLQSVQVYA